MRTAAKSINLISKSQTCTCITVLYISFLRLQCRYFARLKRRTSWLHIFMEKLSYVLTKNFVACVPVRFYLFHCCLFSPCWPVAFLVFSPPLWSQLWKFHVFLPTKLITLSSSFSVIHVSVYIKNNIEKDSIFLLFFLSKSPISMRFPAKKTSRCFLVATPVDWIILQWYVCGADGWADVRSPGAHNPQRATSIRSCHGVFMDQFIFRTVLARILNIF